MPFPKKVLIPFIIHLLSHLVRSLQIFVVSFLVILGVSTTIAHAESIPEKAPANGVYDPHHYLDDATVKQIESLNEEYAKTKLRPQIGVVLIDHLDNGLEETANKTARNWKIGYQDTKMGVLTLIAIKDKKIRTEVSSPLGVYLTDQKAYQLNETIKSDFRNGAYSKGLLKYLVELDTQLQPVLTKSEKELKDKESKSKDEELQSSLIHLLSLIGLIANGSLIAAIIAYKMDSNSSSSSSNYYNHYDDIPPYNPSTYWVNDNFDDDNDDTNSSDDSSDYWISGDSFDSGDSSGGWSSSDWGGGGFDGGGSSGGW